MWVLEEAAYPLFCPYFAECRQPEPVDSLCRTRKKLPGKATASLDLRVHALVAYIEDFPGRAHHYAYRWTDLHGAPLQSGS